MQIAPGFQHCGQLEALHSLGAVSKSASRPRRFALSGSRSPAQSCCPYHPRSLQRTFHEVTQIGSANICEAGDVRTICEAIAKDLSHLSLEFCQCRLSRLAA